MYYIAHRLFSAHDRALGAYVAHRLASRVGADAVFLPFCDTNEEDLSDACKGRRLYELDRERLRSVDGMIALLHGPSLDDGVCMEIGYVAALGLPIIALTTDFQTYGLTRDGPTIAFPDPLLDILLTQVIRVHRLAPPVAHSGDRFEAFLGRNLRPLRLATDQAIAALLLARPHIAASHASIASSRRSAFIEPSPYLQRDLWRDASHMLNANGWDVHLSTRFRHTDESHKASRADWAALMNAGLALIDPAGPETPPGAAIIVGACAASGRLVLAADPGECWTFAEGREPNWRNLMIQYAINGRFRNTGEFAKLAGLH